MSEDQFKFNDVAVVRHSCLFVELRGVAVRVKGRYLNTRSYEVVWLGKDYVIPGVDLMPVPAFVQEPPPLPNPGGLPEVMGVRPDMKPFTIDPDNGKLNYNGDEYVPAARLVEVARRYAVKYDMCDVIDRALVELGVKIPTRKIKFVLEVPENALVDGADNQDWEGWDSSELVRILGITLNRDLEGDERTDALISTEIVEG